MAINDSEDLAGRVKAIFDENLIISKKFREIDLLKDMLKSSGVRLNESVEYAQELMDKGVQLEDKILDYAFYHYGSRANGKIEGIKKFFTNFSKYGNQLILENCMGHNGETTPGGMEGYEERSISLGRLQQDAYSIEMPNRLVKTLTDNLKIFKESKGWKGSQKEILLNDFIYNLDDGSTKLAEAIQKTIRTTFEQNKFDGIYIDIFSPRNTERRFGGTITYDSEPHRSLIVGDEAVRHYLKNQKLEVVTKSVSPMEIPNV